MQTCWNFLEKTHEITSSELILWRVLAFWNHCGSVHSAWISVAQSWFSKTVLFNGIYYSKSGKMMESKLIYHSVQTLKEFQVCLVKFPKDWTLSQPLKKRSKYSLIYSWSIGHILEHEFSWLGHLGCAGSKEKKWIWVFLSNFWGWFFQLFVGKIFFFL